MPTPIRISDNTHYRDSLEQEDGFQIETDGGGEYQTQIAVVLSDYSGGGTEAERVANRMVYAWNLLAHIPYGEALPLQPTAPPVPVAIRKESSAAKLTNRIIEIIDKHIWQDPVAQLREIRALALSAR